MPIDDSGTPVGIDEPEPGAAQRRIVLSFCGTVLLGVLLCAGYLASGGTRAATRSTPASKPLLIPAAPVSAAPVPPPVEAVAIRPAPKPPAQAIVGATYLQMAAVDRGVANVYVEVLRRKGFQAVIAAGPTPVIFRVLVGPVNDTATLTRVKAELQAAGFSSFTRKLTSQ